MSESKNDSAWGKLFEKYQILARLENSDYFSISSREIKEFREARLMTKFDHRSQMPKIFSDNKLSILPVSRGDYIIGRFETFHNFTQVKDKIETKKITFPTFIESLNPEDITSEATAINCAFISGIIQDFTGESALHPTISGRMSSLSFDFNIDMNAGKKLLHVKVCNSQIEIDGGYEGDDSLIIIEAKNDISDDFIVRQLFYPYKLWIKKVTKKVRPVFLTYTNGVFHLREYIFSNRDHYNSIQLVKQKRYEIQEEGTINIEVIQKILASIVITKEPSVAFPQADLFPRIINLCELLKHKFILNKEEIIKMMRNADLHNVKSSETYKRRSSTVSAWIKWIVSLVEE